MKLTELARRLESAADDLASMRATLAAEAPLAPPGAGPAQELITMLNAAWAKRQQHLSSLTTEVTDLADNLRRAASAYATSDRYATETLTSTDRLQGEALLPADLGLGDTERSTGRIQGNMLLSAGWGHHEARPRQPLSNDGGLLWTR